MGKVAVRLSSLAGIVVLGLICGCGPGGPEIASVEGTVTMDGKPLANAAVVFIPENGRPAGATTDSQGHYVLNFTSGRKGAIPGKNSIRITTLRDAGEDENGNPIPAQRETVPMKYNAASELTFEVKEGEKNVANFDLVSGGPLGPTEE
ncbi:MAG: carboxypeptidase regulatory-like domain-containing protein [Planctomycetes bacterium]|nr:carboxypeptidase regulatory-like domain-containing protein [Planctomycetota bacterium]